MKKVIMIVEDEFAIREDIQFILESNDYEVLEAENGLEALKVVEKVVPDLIISDIMMPIMDGWELLAELQKSPALASIPFLFLTARIDKKDLREGMKLGADDYITKPFNFDELLGAIETRLRKKELTNKKIEETFEDLKTTIKYSLPHEIRNPLNVIFGFTDLLRNNLETTSKEDAKDMLNHIYTSCMRLNNLFENYLLMANLEMLNNDREDLDKKLLNITLSPESIINDTVNQISAKYERSKDCTLSLEDARIHIDDDYFKKVVSEIADNCFKFSKQGEKVHITSKIEQKHLVFEFKDFGRGMKQEEINRISEYIQFERRLYEQQGIGMGLTLSKKIIEVFRGVFHVESKPGEYTKITLKIPRVLF